MTNPTPHPTYLADALDRIADADAMLVGQAGSLHTSELAHAVRQGAATLESNGCGLGERVAILTECPASAFGAALASAYIGAIPAILHRGWFSRDLDTALSAVTPKVVVADRRTSERLTGSAALVFDTFSATGTILSEAPLTPPVRDTPAHAAEAAEEPPTDGLVVFSSGTTGTPTAFHHTESALRAAADIVRLDTSGVSGALVTTDPSSSATLLTILELLASGSTVELRPRWTVKAISDALTAEIDLVVATAPRVHGFLAKSPEGTHLGVADRRLISTGGPLMADLSTIEDAGLASTVASRYELAEVTGWVTDRLVGRASVSPEAASDVLTLGSPLLGAELTVVPGEDTIGPLLVSGRRAVRSRVRAGNLHPVEATPLPVGDLARTDDRDGIQWMGRAGDRFVHDGRFVHPVVQEAAIAGHEGVAEVAIVARPDAVHGSIGVVVTVPTDPSDPPFLDELVTRLDEASRLDQPRAQWITNSLPLTPDGRIQRRLLGYEEMTRGPAPSV